MLGAGDFRSGFGSCTRCGTNYRRTDGFDNFCIRDRADRNCFGNCSDKRNHGCFDDFCGVGNVQNDCVIRNYTDSSDDFRLAYVRFLCSEGDTDNQNNADNSFLVIGCGNVSFFDLCRAANRGYPVDAASCK